METLRMGAQLRMGTPTIRRRAGGRRCMSPTDDGDSETVQACPACDSSSVATNNIGGIQSVNPDADRYQYRFGESDLSLTCSR